MNDNTGPSSPSQSSSSVRIVVKDAMCATDRRRRAAANRRKRDRVSSKSCACIVSVMFHSARALSIRQQSPLRAMADRNLQGSGLTVGSSVDLESCYADLYESDVNLDGNLSPEEYLTFVQASAEEKLDTNQWGLPITQFWMLPEEYIGIYNLFACGDANFVCPSVVGIDISGVAGTINGDGDDVSTQQQTLLFQLCKDVQQAHNNLTARPTNSPTVDGIGGPTDAPTRQPVAGTGAPTTSPETPAPTISSVTSPPTTPPTASGPPPCPPRYVASFSYGPGDLVTVGGSYYRCRAGQQSGWCSQAAYEPGNAIVDWSQAWTLIGECDDGGERATAEPTAAPASDTVAPTRAPGTPEEKYYDLWWDDLPPDIREAYVVLGFNETTWNAGDTTQYDELLWDEMTPEQREAAIYIGYTEKIWCATPAPTDSEAPAGPSGPSEYIFPTYAPTAKPQATSKPTPAVIATLPPTTAPTPKPTGYTGPLPATFQYEIYNTLGLDARGIKSSDSTMNALRGSTTEFVEFVVDDTFATVGNGRERGLRGGIRRQALVILSEANPATIEDVEDVVCSDPLVALAYSGSGCQKVTAGAVLTVVNEREDATALRFQRGLSASLEDPGMSFSEASGVVYVGPATSTSGGGVPEATQPGFPPGEDPPAEEGGGTPGWVVPVSITAAALGVIVLAMFVGQRLRKRRRSAIEYDSRKDPGILESEVGSASFNEEVEIDRSKTSSTSDPFARRSYDGGPLGPGHPKAGGNPFLSQKSSSSGVSYSSYSKSVSSSGSDEDISDDPREHSNNMGREGVLESPGSIDPEDRRDSWQLGTLHEVSEENLSTSGWSLMSGSDKSKSDRSVYRAGVEALVKEACPEKHDRIDEMMKEYEGREDVLIGHLSTMLATKNGSGGSSDSEDSGTRPHRTSDITLSTAGKSGSGSGHTFSSSVLSGDNRSTFSTLSTAEEDRVEPIEQPKRILDRKESLQAMKDMFSSQTAFARAELDDSDYSSSSSSEGSVKVDRRAALEDKGASEAILEAGGSAAAAALDPRLSITPSDIDDDDSSSSAGSSDWSSDDGLSSIDTSSLSRASSLMSGETPPDGKLPKGQGLSGYHGTTKPSFLPVNPSGDNGENSSPENSPGRGALEDAIQAGDWKAVGTTAALITDPYAPTVAAPAPTLEDLGASTFSVSSHEMREVDELEKLVDDGNWEGLMAAASRIEEGSERDGASRMSGLDDSESDAMDDLDQKRISESTRGSMRSRSVLIAEIEKLVETVVPDEINNIDEMLLQFSGREEKLLETLQTMRDKDMSEDEFYDQLESSANSKLSVFERDPQFTRSTMDLSVGNASDVASEDDRDASAHEELQLCSECGRRRSRSEFSVAQLEVPISAHCRECEAIAGFD